LNAPEIPRPMGTAVSDQVLFADLKRYCQLAIRGGASEAVVIPAAYVTVDERVRLKCIVPRCPRAGETPYCPPNAPDLDLSRRAFGRFSWGVLFKYQIEPVAEYDPTRKNVTKAEQRRTLSFHTKSSEIVYSIERQAYKDGYHLAMGFGGGSCKDYLCQGLICQFLDSGRCRFPGRSRPAMEAMGIDVISLVNKAGWNTYALLDDLTVIPCAVTVGMVLIC